MTQTATTDQAPLLKGFFDRCKNSDRVQSGVRNIGAATAGMAFTAGSLFGMHAWTEHLETRQIAQNTVNGVYQAQEEKFGTREYVEDLATWARGGEELDSYFTPRMSPQKVKELPTHTDRTQALASVANEQVPDLTKTSVTAYAQRYHLDARDMARLAETKEAGKRGIFDTPGFGSADVEASVAVAQDVENLRSYAAVAALSVGQNDVARRLQLAQPPELAAFAAKFGEEQAQRLTAENGDANTAKHMATLSLAGVQSLHEQRSPVFEMDRDHPAEWTKTATIPPRTKPKARPDQGMDRS